MIIIPQSLEQACKDMQNKKLGEVESIGNHDIGINVQGICKYTKTPCNNFIPDHPQTYQYETEKCEIYKKIKENK